MIRSIVMALAICLACSAPALAAGKIGIVNLIGITANSDVGKAADKLLQDRFGKERTALEKQGETLKKDMDQFRKQAAAMSEDARNKKGRDLQTRIQEFEKKQNDLNQRIAPVQGAVDKQLLEVLSEACSTYAKANDYDLILNYNPSITPFANESVNVSEGVLAEANKIWKKKGGKFNVK